MIRFGMLSAAHGHADAYASDLHGIEGAELVAVADGDDDRGEAFADEHGIDYGPTDEVLDRIDAAVVCSANATHREWVESAAEAGVHVLCEKPLATSVADARAIVDACDDAGVLLGVAMPVRFNEPIRQAKRAYDAGELGKLQAVVGTNLLRWKGPGGWFTDPELSGGGAIMDHTVHVVDLARWITGEEVSEVYAESGTRFVEKPVEDVDVLSMELGDGTPFTHDGSWRMPETWDFWGDVTLRLIGTESVMEVDCFDQTLKETTATDGIESVFWGEGMNEGLLRDFVSAVRDGRPPAIPGEDGVREVAVVEAAYESVETGEPVGVRYV